MVYPNTMRITLIHNPSAGTRTAGRDELIGALASHGHDVLYQSMEAGDFAHALGVPADVVIACGGDGTVGKVACALLYRAVPLAIVPRGTANNIAGFLGIEWFWGKRMVAPLVGIGGNYAIGGVTMFIEGQVSVLTVPFNIVTAEFRGGQPVRMARYKGNRQRGHATLRTGIDVPLGIFGRSGRTRLR